MKMRQLLGFALFAGIWIVSYCASSGAWAGDEKPSQTEAPQDSAKADKESEEKLKPVNLLGLFQMHYDFRVRSFREQNEMFGHVVLLGDSITEGFDVATYFPNSRVLNRGIGGDVIGNALPEDDRRGVLRRLDESVFECDATHLFLMIGINDLNSGRQVEVMEKGYREILSRIKKRAPELKVHIQSLLPTRGQFADRNAQVLAFNKRLQALAKEFGYQYLDLHSLMADEEGLLKDEFTDDGLHLTPKAYRLWRREIARALDWPGARSIDEE